MDWSALDRHAGRVAVYFSGGKDSTAVLWMLRQAGLLDRVTAYHGTTLDLFPEMVAHVDTVRAWCPNFVTVESDARAWARQHGDPSDLVPHSSHQIGQGMAEGGKLSSRYDCCVSNLMQPVHDRVTADGNTLAIRGTRRDDMKRLPMASGENIGGLELLLPLEGWTEAQVFDFIAENNIPIPSFYSHFRQGPECMTCPAWWNVDAGPYLRTHHPAKFEEYRDRVATVMREVSPCLANLKQLLAVFDEVK